MCGPQSRSGHWRKEEAVSATWNGCCFFTRSHWFKFVLICNYSLCRATNSLLRQNSYTSSYHYLLYS